MSFISLKYQGIMSKLRVFCSQLGGKYLLLTNTLACSGLLACGDIATQYFFSNSTQHQTDWDRVRRMLTIGVVIGPFNHYWYRVLDAYLPGKTVGTVAKKILADQIIASPFFAFTFFMGSGALEGKEYAKSWEEFSGKFWTVYKMDWSIWPAAQSINFFLLPPKFRVIYVSLVTLGWNMFLSYMKHRQ